MPSCRIHVKPTDNNLITKSVPYGTIPRPSNIYSSSYHDSIKRSFSTIEDYIRSPIDTGSSTSIPSNSDYSHSEDSYLERTIDMAKDGYTSGSSLTILYSEDCYSEDSHSEDSDLDMPIGGSAAKQPQPSGKQPESSAKQLELSVK